jgi:hypothetical protein
MEGKKINTSMKRINSSGAPFLFKKKLLLVDVQLCSGSTEKKFSKYSLPKRFIL